jgi:uncharacterized spore protein YtfJ
METTNKEIEAVFDQVRGSRDALSVRRVFGDPYELDGVTVIPVARVTGGAGGGGGTGEGPDGKGTGSGSGTGFGLRARGIGVYEVRDGKVEWKPAIDVTSLAKGGQMLGALVIMCLTLVLVRRRRDE